MKAKSKLRAKEALEEIKKLNRQNNDTDAYLYEMANWGLGIRPDKPNPSDYGCEGGSYE